MLTSEIVIRMTQRGDYTTEVTYRTNILDTTEALKELAELQSAAHEAAELESECRSADHRRGTDERND